MPDAMLHLMCGKIAAGKSTLSSQLSAESRTIRLSEDQWLSRLYPAEINTIADYVRLAARLRATIAPHVEDLLRAGLSVVLDFPANTVANRVWMRGIIERFGARHVLHHLDASDEVCRARLRARNAAGGHDFAATDAEFDAITAQFVPPTKAEGFTVEVHRTG